MKNRLNLHISTLEGIRMGFLIGTGMYIAEQFITGISNRIDKKIKEAKTEDKQ